MGGSDGAGFDVSRETFGLARDIFGAGAQKAQRYAELLVTTGVEHGLIGPREAERIWQRHLFNCAVVAAALPPAARVVDLGSGAGLPGIPLVLARPDLSAMMLVEPLQRRVAFLKKVVTELDLRQVDVRRARAEDLRGLVAVDVVTARAVARLDRLATLALPLVVPGGSLLALKGAQAQAELEDAEKTLRRLGAARWDVEQWGGTMLPEPTTVVRIVAGPGGRHGRSKPSARPSRRR